jgi:chemotaxis methyl-accepting protein methylase
MSKFKLEKEVLPFNTIIWHYRDFIIKNKSPNSPYPVWVVKFSSGKEVYSNGNGTRKEMIEWVDDYYTEMNDFNNSVQLIND